MTRKHIIFVGALIAAATSPALAEKSDRAFVEQMRMQIAAARAEPGVASAGATELAAAEARLPELYTALDNNETEDTRATRDGINALIEAARMRARAQAVTAQPASYTPAPAATAPSRMVHRAAYKRRAPVKSCAFASR